MLRQHSKPFVCCSIYVSKHSTSINCDKLEKIPLRVDEGSKLDFFKMDFERFYIWHSVIISFNELFYACFDLNIKMLH